MCIRQATPNKLCQTNCKSVYAKLSSFESSWTATAKVLILVSSNSDGHALIQIHPHPLETCELLLTRTSSFGCIYLRSAVLAFTISVTCAKVVGIWVLTVQNPSALMTSSLDLLQFGFAWCARMWLRAIAASPEFRGSYCNQILPICPLPHPCFNPSTGFQSNLEQISSLQTYTVNV